MWLYISPILDAHQLQADYLVDTSNTSCMLKTVAGNIDVSF